MLDYAITLAPELHESMRQARAYEAERSSWLRRYRELQRADRREHRHAARKPDVTAPTAGSVAAIYKMWI